MFSDVTLVSATRPMPMSTPEYLRLVRTFGPFRARPPRQQHPLGGGTVLDLRTTLALARRAAPA